MYHKVHHYPSGERRWDAEKAVGVIEEICRDSVASFDAESGWPAHPIDDIPYSNLYLGSLGVLWTIDYLRSNGCLDTGFNPALHLEMVMGKLQPEYDKFPYPDNASFFFGRLPALLMQFKDSQQPEKADEIEFEINKNLGQPIRELLWGMPGSMLAARFMYDWTGDKRWKSIFLSQAEKLLSEMHSVDNVGHVWTQDLYGERHIFLGTFHGFCGNLIPIIAGKNLLPTSEFETYCFRAIETIKNTATTNGKYANWIQIIDEPESVRNAYVLQYCHGAPGVISSLADIPTNLDPELDALLEQAGELVWAAGPLKKGSSLCHGTAGNGYAFLKLYERTGNEIWLDRARAFAMDAIAQYEMATQLYRQGRYSLWIGDLGVAVYLWDCVRAKARIPTIDIF